MPARRRTANTPSGSKEASDSPLSPQSEDPAYQLKRKKNNEAVQRTREKTKKTAEERKKRIDGLRRENDQLKVQIEQGEKHIATLRDLIIHGEKTEDGHRIIAEILAGPDPADDHD
ncbi:hypothetical protein KR018_006321 [Drosophila ironensis]|nr:hypothetical protein KR018_006321 [Drosophila ironensis]